jgi:hypothetical protein
VSAADSPEHRAQLIPAGALAEWLRLAAELEEADVVPCRAGDLEAWWPDKSQADSDATQEAIAGCWRCPARAACADYAVAAGEREGVWGGLLPTERRPAGRTEAA